MRYLQSFHRRLRQLREFGQLSRSDIAEICGVDEARVARWEASDANRRLYPAVDELMDLCLRTETSLDALLDIEDAADEGQMELPGLTFSNGQDLTDALNQLERELDRAQPTEEEAELLRRFRNSSAENRRLVLQILGK